ncbi:hypothetical protein L6R52_33170, partial [Myxococcota bacterium]|nr:hypothetical protein [Myxococcota bacterium]
LELELDVEPSIVVRELDPVTASCTGPAKRALGGAAYHLRVEAIGFTPVTYTYTLSAPALDAAPLAIRHLASGRFDLAGERGDLVFPEVPDGMPSYRAIVTIQALGDDGRTRSTAFAIGVHRPIELFYDGNVDVAEILAPVPVSGCIPGGEAGRDVTYGESVSETRQRSYDVSWNESWLASHTVSSGGSQTVGASETNGVGFATTDGQSWSWSLGTTVSGELGLSDLVKVGVSVSGSVGGGGSTSVERSGNRSASLSAESTTTDTESATAERGGGRGESFSWEVSSTQSVSRSYGGRVIAGHYGVFYRQAMRLLRRGQLVTYNQCGAATVVGDVDFSDWAWSPDLALARQCPPLPASNLPEARCMIPPCSAD